LRIADFKCGLKIAPGKSDGNSFVKQSVVFYWLIGIILAAVAIAAAFYFDNTVRDFMTRHRGQRRSALIASRAKKLNVTADQTTKVHALILAREQKKNELRQQYKGQDKTAWKDQLKQSHDQFIDGMKATLTPEQFEKLEQQKRQRRLTFHFMRETSRFGDWPAHFALGLFLAGIAWWRGSKKWTRIFLSMLIALGIAGVVGRGIQMATGRARPSVRTEEVWNGARFNPKYQAFPSGHVGASTAFFGVLFLANRRIGLACLSIPILIGFSRIYLGAHYLSDVVCAAVLGFLCALLTARLLLPIDDPKSRIGN